MTKQSIPEHIFHQFLPGSVIHSVEPFGNGHINDTFKVTVEPEGKAYILQKKNHFVFKDIDGMMTNIQKVTGHIRKKCMSQRMADADRRVMTYLPANNGKYYFRTDTGDYWTVCIFIENSITIEKVTNVKQAWNTGKAFGIFQQQLEDLPGASLKDTIPNFHNGIKRFNDFNESLQNAPKERLHHLKEETEILTSLAEEMMTVQTMLDTGVLPLRITHNDTKINNVLFDQEENILCIIDLDTVMPGTVLFDFGDAVRTLCNTGAEDDRDVSTIQLNQPFFTSFSEGYLSIAKSFLTPKEWEWLPVAGIYMTWEQALRFGTDYLNGDVYYKIKYPEHNLFRTKAQTAYLRNLLKNKSFMTNTIFAQVSKKDEL